MTPDPRVLGCSPAGLLIDTNLLVLFVVGSVNPHRIASFKRTRAYARSDYDLLLQLLSGFNPLYTLAHVMAEVSNLTDLSGPERLHARLVLREALTILREPHLSSSRAAANLHYPSLGLADAAIVELALEHRCTVLTDDLDLYLSLSRESLDVINFAHVRESRWGA